MALSRLVLEECLEVVFHSNSYKGYRLSKMGKLLATQGEPQPEIVQDGGPVALPEDVFDDVIGHDDVKELRRAAVIAERPVMCSWPSRRRWPRASSSGT